MKAVKQLLRVALSALAFFAPNFAKAQTSVDVQKIYGGRINTMAGFAHPTTVDQSVVFVATESANSLFYATVSTPPASSVTFSNFQVLPCASADDNYGSGIQRIATHRLSQSVYFIASSNLIKSTTPYTTCSSVGFTNVSDIVIRQGYAFILNDGTTFNYGTLNA